MKWGNARPSSESPAPRYTPRHLGQSQGSVARMGLIHPAAEGQNTVSEGGCGLTAILVDGHGGKRTRWVPQGCCHQHSCHPSKTSPGAVRRWVKSLVPSVGTGAALGFHGLASWEPPPYFQPPGQPVPMHLYGNMVFLAHHLHCQAEAADHCPLCSWSHKHCDNHCSNSSKGKVTLGKDWMYHSSF